MWIFRITPNVMSILLWGRAVLHLLMGLRMIFPGGMSDVLSRAIDDFNSEVSLMEGYLEGKFSKAARESYTERIGSLQKALEDSRGW